MEVSATAQRCETEMRQSITTQRMVRDQTASSKFDEKLSSETCLLVFHCGRLLLIFKLGERLKHL